MTERSNGSGAQAAAPLIEARQIAVSLDGTPILRDISFALRAGEMVGLIGPNGAGKTTLLKALGGLIPHVAGSLKLEGRPLEGLSPREVARRVAYVPQGTVTDFAFTVREIVLMGRSPHLGRFQIEQASDRRIAAEAMRRMRIEHLAERFINTLSGGERQRAFIARALAQQPRVLLLDEPTANLDVKHQLDVLELAVELAQHEGLGIVAAIHDLNLAAHYCDRLVLLHEGRRIADDTPEAVLTPANLHDIFGVSARVYRDPYTDVLRLSLSRNGAGRVPSDVRA